MRRILLISTLILCPLFSACAGGAENQSDKLHSFSIKPADINKVSVVHLNGDRLRIEVRGHLGDSCSSVYEKEVKTFQTQRTIYIVIPVIRRSDRYCTQVLKEFERVFEFNLNPSQSMPAILVNGICCY